MPVDYVPLIAALSRSDKIRFYIVLARDLTIATRMIWADLHLSDAERVEQMKWVNEVQHRVINRLADLHGDYGTWTEQQVWDVIWQHLAQDRATAAHVRGALKRAYERVAPSGE